MPMWRCPHCGTPQAESSRCWVCKRSSTSCGTCRHFRRAIAGHLGYCGLDRQRLPLRGDEQRGCWQEAAHLVDVRAPATVAPVAGERPAVSARRQLEFVPVDAVEPAPVRGTRVQPTEPARPAPPVDPPGPALAPPTLGFWADEG